MNLILITIISLSCVTNLIEGAPVVSNVHVTFVTGNKATRYSHGTGSDGHPLQFLSDEDGLLGNAGEHHDVRKRSVPPTHEPHEGLTAITGSILTTSDLTMNIKQPSTRTRANTPAKSNTATPAMGKGATDADAPTSTLSSLLRTKKRVRFIKRAESAKIPVAADTIRTTRTPPVTTMTNDDKTADIVVDEDGTSKKVKDTKAVKRSPFLGSFDFPDFDDFGGNDFGSVGNFGSSNRNPGHRTSYSQHNPESLAPDGVFSPPVPTQEATHYVENDPYLADPETAKYAAQRPPFFSEFPHKRTVLALNGRREANGLETNILRSIRPYFAFFEINNHARPVHHHYRGSPHNFHPRPPYFFDDLGPAVIFYANQIRPRVDPWSLYTA